MPPTLGARLRAQREQQQIALSTIAARMKIRLSLLEQLESDRISSWPKGIFGRAYLRDYARLIGLEPEAIVRDFLELYPDTPDDPFSLAATEDLAAGGAPPTGLRRLMTAAISAIPGRLPRDGQPLLSLSSPGPASASPPLPASPPGRSDRRRGRDRRQLNLSATAELCGRLARAADGRDVTALLADAATLLDAVGVSIWLWDAGTLALRPSLAHGYSAEILSSLPAVRADEPNALAAAFRSGDPVIVDGGGEATGAVVVPSIGPGGCVGVVAVEVRHGSEHHEGVRAFALILAAQLGALLPSPSAT